MSDQLSIKRTLVTVWLFTICHSLKLLYASSIRFCTTSTAFLFGVLLYVGAIHCFSVVLLLGLFLHIFLQSANLVFPQRCPQKFHFHQLLNQPTPLNKIPRIKIHLNKKEHFKIVYCKFNELHFIFYSYQRLHKNGN